MKSVRYTTTLFFYDGPQVIEARDEIGGYYIAIMVEPEKGHDRYLVAGVAPERLRQFRSGTLDLRSLLIEERGEDWYLSNVQVGLNEPLALELQHTPLTDSGFLPDPGFVLHSVAVNDAALNEARKRNNLVVEVSVDPPEAAQEHRIRVATLVGLLDRVQTLVKHAYRASIRDLSQHIRREIDRLDAHLLDVVIPAAPGSFQVLLEAAKLPDMFGQSELERAFERVDALFKYSDDPQAALENAKAHRGHLACAYVRLLRFLVEHKTGLRYTWAEPTFTKPKIGAVTEAQAGPLVNALSGISNLGAETVKLVGALEKADVANCSWRLSTGEGTASGRIKDGGPTLEGLKIGATYRFTCLEEIEESEGTGREKSTLYLIEREPVS